MRRYLYTIILLALSLVANAQTLYEMKFFDPQEKAKYLGLFVYTNDNDCYLRCIREMPNAKGEYTFWQHDYFCSYEREDGLNYMHFMPTPKKNSDDEIDYAYPVYSMVFSKTGEFREQMFMTYMSRDDDDDPELTECRRFRELSLLEKDEDYFLKFFNSDEPMYKRIVKARKLLLAQGEVDTGDDDTDDNTGDGDSDGQNTPVAPVQPVQPVQPVTPVTPVQPVNTPATFHLILVAATNDASIGKSVETDYNLVQKQFSAIAKNIGMTYDEQSVKGSSFSKANVDATINNLSVGPNDVLAFVYSGHGFRFDDDTDPYPEMYLRYNGNLEGGDYLGVTDVYNRLLKKNARFTLMLTDCCNSKYGMNRTELESAAFQTRAVNSNTDIKKLKMLFEQQGSVRATAAKAGQYALCDASGGFMITSILNNLQSQVSALSQTDPSWNTIVENASAYVKKKTSQQIDEAGNPIDPQIVVRAVKVSR